MFAFKKSLFGTFKSVKCHHSLTFQGLILPLRLSVSTSNFDLSRFSVAMSSSAGVAETVPKSRRYPEDPRVGVGVVVFRHPPPLKINSEVLVIRRSKSPSRGCWSFPGGSLELGETIAECAIREVEEETGVRLVSKASPESEEGFSDRLNFPTPFAACDCITKDRDGKLEFHYAVIEVAAVAEDPNKPLQPQDDVDEATWMEVKELRSLKDLTESCAKFAEEAVTRFG